jgi:exodeoxyribonuclease VII large subunit
MKNQMGLPFRHILTVSELTREIKDILETSFSDIWIEGEISNLKIPPSGHIYFTLKDEFSQIRAVLFRMQARALRFLPEDGMHVICRGRVSLYERRGDYQLILEGMEPKGVGALQLAFLQLKERLQKEGYFEQARKKALPMIPRKIGIVTSPTGAVIRDMLHVIERRFENVHVLLHPVRVQGEGAAIEIANAINYFNAFTDVELIIVARGGGSLEDLWAFNEEKVARAIYLSRIPVISAVGHETDYTISDFVADLRAPTPSAAAELAVRNKREVKGNLDHFRIRMESQIRKILRRERTHQDHLKKTLADPKKRIEAHLLRIDELTGRCSFLVSWSLKRKREKGFHLGERLSLRNPLQRIETLRLLVAQGMKDLEKGMSHSVAIRRQKWEALSGKLDSLSPLAILQRGYSISRRIPTMEILKDAASVGEGEKIEVKLHRGALRCGVEGIEKP